MRYAYTIAQIKEMIQDVTDSQDPRLLDLLSDERKGVQTAVKRQQTRIKKQQKLVKDHENRLQFENNAYQSGIQFVAGVDEVGRGPLAGPVVAAAVILPQNTKKLIGVNDSKQLSLAKREQFALLIKEEAVSYNIVEVNPKEIDRLNILEASRKAMELSVAGLAVQPQQVLIDAMTIQSSIAQQSIIKGDQRSLSIAAASIIAKVHRDHLMIELAKDYPEFEFDKNMGYGTKDHLSALKNYGYTPIHRQSFSPVARIETEYQL